ncbi:MAG: hypothetical protein AAF221_00235 [Pseudomonadota bacterium]
MMIYCDRGLQRLGAALVAQEQPVTKGAAAALLKTRLGAYLQDKAMIDTILKARYS